MILDLKIFTCKQCGRQYKHARTLKRHQKVECGREPPFKCQYCERRFSHKHSYKYHMAASHKMFIDEAKTTYADPSIC